MAHYRATIEAPVSMTEAFDRLARFDSTAEWDPGVSAAEMLTPEPVALGSAFRVAASFAGRTVPLHYEVVEFERPYRLRVRAENASTISDDTITFTPGDDPDHPRVTVTYDATLELKGAFRLFGPIMGVAFGRIGDRAAGGLRAWLLDRATPATTPAVTTPPAKT